MKKTVTILLSVLFMVPTLCLAQLKVDTDGNIIAGVKLHSNNPYWKLGLQSGISSTSRYPICIGLYGRTDGTADEGLIFGVMGVASNSGGSTGYGVAGCLNHTAMTGAGIFGSTQHEGGTGLHGRYAGYFNGATMVNGTLTATSYNTTSDLRLSENVTPVTARNSRVLDKVLDMNVVEYNYRKVLPSLILPDSVSAESVMKAAGIDTEKRHIGLMAQEVQKLFPNLVEKGQDGYLTVNYVELVPVLIRSIQELKAELEELKGGESRTTRSSFGDDDESSLSPSDTGNALYQNRPNPFREQTTIRFTLSDKARNAAICIFDMTGKMLKQMPVEQGMTSVTVNGSELGQGMFLYSLVVNGQEIDTKRMILSR